MKEEHKEVVNAAMSNGCRDLRPSLLINPSIIRLNEGKHMCVVAEEGPMSVPGSPNHARIITASMMSIIAKR